MWNSSSRSDHKLTPPISHVADNFNNNPYSWAANPPKGPSAQDNSDPWNWGWGDSGGSNGDHGGGGGGGKNENESWETQPLAHQQQYKQPYNTPIQNNSNDYFENVDLKKGSKNATSNSLFNQPPLPPPTNHQTSYQPAPYNSHHPTQQHQQQNFSQQPKYPPQQTSQQLNYPSQQAPKQINYPPQQTHQQQNYPPQQTNHLHNYIQKQDSQLHAPNSSYSPYFQAGEPQLQNYPLTSTPINQYSPVTSPPPPQQISYSNPTPQQQQHLLQNQFPLPPLLSSQPQFQPVQTLPQSKYPPSVQPQPSSQYSQPQFPPALSHAHFQPLNYNQNPQPLSQQQNSYPASVSILNNPPNSNIVNNNSVAPEVENIEIVPPEKTETSPAVGQVSTSPQPPVTSAPLGGSSTANVVPENQENVPENEERPPNPDHITTSMSNLRLNSPARPDSVPASTSSADVQWTSSSWENQEVAPRCTVDRDQYLETGHLHPPQLESALPQQTSTAIDNDEGEAAPPPGLHRMVTGQGQSTEQERLVVGSLPPPQSIPPAMSQRPQVPGHSTQPTPDMAVQSSLPPLGQRMIPGQLRDGDMERMVLGSSGNSTNDSLPTIQSRGDQSQSNPVLQRTVTGGRSNIMQQQPSENVSQRTVPGGSSSSSVSGGSNGYAQIQDLQADERLVLGRPTVDQGDDRLPLQQNQPSSIMHNVRSSSASSLWGSNNVNNSHQDLSMPHPSTYHGDSDHASQPSRPPSNGNNGVGAEQSRGSIINEPPPPNIQRMVVGHMDSNSRGGSASGDEASQSSAPPRGLHRMVLGEQQHEHKPQDQQQEQKPPNQTQQKPQSQAHSLASNPDNDDNEKDREIDSDCDYRSNRRKTHNRRDSGEDDSYASDRERDRGYWDRRYDRGRRRVYDHSPEYRSDEELDRERNDFRDPRDPRVPRDSRDYRPKQRDRDRGHDRERGDTRRRRSPDYYYRDEYRDDPRRRGGPYYEQQHHYRNRDMYEDEYYYSRENRSRPSSRTGTEYSRRAGGPGSTRDYPPVRNVNPYYQDQGGASVYNYTHYYNHLEQMRINNPQAYAAWYIDYMNAKGQHVQQGDDRTSVISGRNSANHHQNDKSIMDESVTAHKRLNSTIISGPSIDDEIKEHDGEDLTADSGVWQRMTPPLYSGGAHIKGKWTKQGQLVVVAPNYPKDGQLANVEMMQLVFSSMPNNQDTLEFLESPGPFIVGVTHKNTVLTYLKKRADLASHNAEKLVYELMRLVIKLNGVVDMTDVADLLMSNYNEDPTAEHDEYSTNQHQQQYDRASQQEVNDGAEISSQQVTDKFRDLLLQGNKLDALEWAIQNKNWGHAFFLASKMDNRSFNNVMLRFANGLAANDPLQTLYQMMSGREPQASTCCADKKWGDWRPHLAMMLSNPSGNPELDRKSIITLGDSLASRGRLFASHFCYVTAQVDFGAYTDRNAKLVLLGTSHLQSFNEFATCRSIMLTLCYEYAKRLNKKDLTIPALLVYKYLLAIRLIENGRLSLASQYLEAIALDIIHRPDKKNRQLAMLVAELADQIKMADPTNLSMITDPNDDPDWLNLLKQLLDDTNDTNQQTSSMSHGISTDTVSTSAADVPPITNQVAGPYYGTNYENTWNVENDYDNRNAQQYPGYSTGQNEVQHNQNEDQYNHQNQYQQVQQIQHQQQTSYVQPQIQPADGATGYNMDYAMPNSLNQHQPLPNINANQWDPNMYSNSWQGQQNHQNQSMVESSAGGSTALTQEYKSSEKKTNKDQTKRSSKKNKEQASSGWFGGIWDKFSFKSKNEMKLPDDKNPSIVWDEKKGRWVNKDEDENDEVTSLKPPPKASDLPGFSNAIPPATSAPPPAPVSAPISSVPEINPVLTSNESAAAAAPNSNVTHQGNIPPSASAAVNKFKMQRVKGMKSNYVDVMNPNSTSKTNVPTSVAAPMMEPVPAPSPPVNNFFIPAPVEANNAPIDFISPSGPVSYESSNKPLDQTTELSRSSSASSLSREVSLYMSRNERKKHSKFIPNSKQNHGDYRNQQFRRNPMGSYATQQVPTYYNPNNFSVT